MSYQSNHENQKKMKPGLNFETFQGYKNPVYLFFLDFIDSFLERNVFFVYTAFKGRLRVKKHMTKCRSFDPLMTYKNKSAIEVGDSRPVTIQFQVSNFSTLAHFSTHDAHAYTIGNSQWQVTVALSADLAQKDGSIKSIRFHLKAMLYKNDQKHV